MIAPKLIIAGVSIPIEVFPATQEYSVLEGATVHRMLSGAALKQQHWRKMSTQITGDGWAPPALAGVDWSAAVEVSCIAPRAIHSAANTATLPAARRSDLAVNVYAHAVVNGELAATPVSVVGNAATATAVSGASAYQFCYYPKFNAYSSGPSESLDLAGAAYGWSITLEEV